MAEQETVIIEVEIDSEAAKKNAAELTVQLEEQRKRLRELRKAFKEGKISSEDYGEQAAELDRNIKATAQSLRNEQKAAEANSNSLNALAQSVARLSAERKKLNTETEEGRERFDQLTIEIKAQTDQLKELEKAAGDTRRNVGNYKEAITEALNETGAFGGVLGQVGTAFNFVSGGIGRATKGLTGLKAAIAATGIGLFLVALGSLVTFFTSTRKGAQELEKVLGGLSGVFGKITTDISKVGEAIFNFLVDPLSALGPIIKTVSDTLKDVFENPLAAVQEFGEAIQNNIAARFEALSNLVPAFGRVLKDLVNLDFANLKTSGEELANTALQAVKEVATSAKEGFSAAADAVAGYGAELADAAVQGSDLAAQNINIREQIRALTSAQAEFTFLAEQNRKQRDDETKSETERLALNERVLEFETKRTEAQKQLNQLRQQLVRNEIETQGGLLKATEEQLDQLAELERERFDILEDFEGRTTEVLTERVSIQRDAALKRAEAEQAGVDAELAIFEARNIAILNAEENLSDERIRLIQQRTQLQIEAATAAAATARQQVENDVRDEEQRAKQIALIEAELQKTIAELNQQTAEQLAGIQQQEIAQAQDTAAAKLEIERNRIEAQLALVKEGSDREAELQKQLAENTRQQRIAQAEQTITDTELLQSQLQLINAEYERDVQQTSSSINEARKSEAQESVSVAQTIAQAATDQSLSEEERRQAVVTAVLDIIQAKIREAVATQITQVVATVPFPANFLVATAATVALEALLATVLGGLQGFAEGGEIKSGVPVRRANGDNVLITAKRGEIVLTRQQAATIGSEQLSLAGVPGFANGGVVGAPASGNLLPVSAADGGASAFNQSQFEANLARAVAGMPAPILDYKQFTTFQNNVVRSTQRANR